MLKRIKAITRTRFKRTNFNSFLFFLFFAVVIWIFVQFSKQYNEVIDIPVKYVNVPPDKLITEDNPRVVKLRMVDNGFKIGWISLLPPTLSIDVSRANQIGDQLVYIFDEHRDEIQTQLNIGFENTRFVNDVLTIDFQQKKEKKVPVFSNISVDFEAGYAATQPLVLSPDSVRVSGPDEVMDTLTRLYTRPLNLRKVKSDMSGKVAIDTSQLRNLTLYRSQISFSLEVERFTEGNVKVPVELKNVPDDLNVVIFPKEILLFYQVNLKEYNKVTASDFRVVADFSDVDESRDFLIPEIRQQPDFVTNLRLNEKRIQFIIKK